jgi:hypothetical protein
MDIQGIGSGAVEWPVRQTSRRREIGSRGGGDEASDIGLGLQGDCRVGHRCQFGGHVEDIWEILARESSLLFARFGIFDLYSVLA